MFEDGLPRRRRAGGAHHGRTTPDVLLKTMVEKGAQPGGRGAVRLTDAGRHRHGRGIRPRQPVPSSALVLDNGAAVVLSVLMTLAVLFGIGVVKSRWTFWSWWASGLEILVIGAIAGVAATSSSVLPVLLGRPPRRLIPSKIIPSARTIAATTNAHAPITSPLTPARSGMAPTNGRSPISTRASARQ